MLIVLVLKINLSLLLIKIVKCNNYLIFNLLSSRAVQTVQLTGSVQNGQQFVLRICLTDSI